MRNTGRRRRSHLVSKDRGLRQLMLTERRPRKLRRSPHRCLRQDLPNGHRCRRRRQSDGGDDAVGRKCRAPIGQVDHPQRLRVMLDDVMLRTQTREVSQLLVGHTAEHRERRLTGLQRRRRYLGDEGLRHVVAWLLLRVGGLRGRGARPAPVSVDLYDKAHLSFRRRFLRASVESDTNWSGPDFMSSKRCLATSADIVLFVGTRFPGSSPVRRAHAPRSNKCRLEKEIEVVIKTTFQLILLSKGLKETF